MTFNGAQFVVTPLNSVVNQLGTEDEVIGVNYGSKGNMVLVIQEIYGDLVQAFVNERNLGDVHTFEGRYLWRVEISFFYAVRMIFGKITKHKLY